MSQRKPRSQSVDRGPRYSTLPHDVQASDAYVSLSHRARAILSEILFRFDGFNNGRIGLSRREIAVRIRSGRHKANAAAFAELIDRGFVEQMRTFPKGSRMATEYRLTFIQTGDERRGFVAATNEWKGWKFSPLETSTETIPSVDAPSTDWKRSVDAPSTDSVEIEEISNSSGDALSTHIVSHPKVVSGGHDSCLMGDEELRAFVTSFLDREGVGAQARLATAVDIPGGTLSKFMSGRPLPEKYRPRLQTTVGARIYARGGR